MVWKCPSTTKTYHIHWLLATGLAYFGLEVSPVPFPDKVGQALLISNIASSVASTVMSTLIITVRILQVPRTSDASQSRWSYAIIEIIVESAAIYATSGLVYLPFLLNKRSDNRAIQAGYIDTFFVYTTVSDSKCDIL